MENFSKLILNAEKLVNYFGKWPCFHDAEICKVILERESATLILEIFISGNLKKKCYTTFKFLNIKNLEINDFNEQNVISNLNLENKENNSWEVDIPSIYGVRMKFECSAIEVFDLR